MATVIRFIACFLTTDRQELSTAKPPSICISITGLQQAPRSCTRVFGKPGAARSKDFGNLDKASFGNRFQRRLGQRQRHQSVMAGRRRRLAIHDRTMKAAISLA